MVFQAEAGWLPRVTAAWQAGQLSNLDYLLYCNLAAGRSFCDLTQWPVAPWVLSDYTSPTLNLSDPKSPPPPPPLCPPSPSFFLFDAFPVQFIFRHCL